MSNNCNHQQQQENVSGTYPFHNDGQQYQDKEEHDPLLSRAHESYFTKTL